MDIIYSYVVLNLIIKNDDTNATVKEGNGIANGESAHTNIIHQTIKLRSGRLNL